MSRRFGNSHNRLVGLARGDYEPPPLVPTGIHALDRALHGGIPLNKLAVIAARTSHGKTATAVRLAVNMATSGRRVVVLWCEDEETEFDLRALSLLSGTPFVDVLKAFRAKHLEPIWKRVPEPKKLRWQQCCHTSHLERPTPEQIADELAIDPGVVYILDLLGEVDWGAGKKHELIGDGLRLIRTAALKSKCLFIGMTQLNREIDKRKAASDNPDKVRPVLSDIENSGQIEQVARVCIIAEKVTHWTEGDEVPTGEYRYHVFKPTLAIATCRWHDALASPDNPEPVRLAPDEPEEDIA
jgi:replicative DNA helicase